MVLGGGSLLSLAPAPASDVGGVYASHDLGDRRGGLSDQLDGLVAQGAHALRLSLVAQVVLRRTLDDQTLNLRCHPQQLVHTDAVEVAGVPAVVATRSVPEVRSGRTAVRRIEA